VHTVGHTSRSLLPHGAQTQSVQHGALSNNLPLELYHHIKLETMDDAIAELQSSKSPRIAAIARGNGAVRSKLWRKWKGITTSRGQVGEDHRVS
jgi:hypothetical protein